MWQRYQATAKKFARLIDDVTEPKQWALQQLSAGIVSTRIPLFSRSAQAALRFWKAPQAGSAAHMLHIGPEGKTASIKVESRAWIAELVVKQLRRN